VSIENSSIIQRSGILNTIMLFCSVLLIAIIYSETFISIKDLWDSSDTYAHGYIILPISFYLIWNKRDELDQIPPSISFLGLALVICCVIMWFLSSLVEVQILKQYSVVAMIPLMFVLFWGWQRTRIIIFPLLFILLSVPFGEAYVPYMIKWVGDFVFVALQLTGIPVFREGNMLFLTSGDWSVVEACSGLRYLIASITLGLLYAYLMYRSFWRRTLFIILSVAVPVFANWIRAYMIIMIGHLSSMKLAVGVDHIVYGWLFFGLVIGLMFYIGTFWREDIAEESKTSVHVSIANGSKDSIKLILAIIVLICAILAGPWLKYQTEILNNNDVKQDIVLPDVVDIWKKTDMSLSTWEPAFRGANSKVSTTYTNGKYIVTVHIEYYSGQSKGGELISSQNVLIKENDKIWRNISEENITVNIINKEIPVSQTILKSRNQKLYVWSSYWIGGRLVVNPYIGKLIHAQSLLFGPGPESAAIIISTNYIDDNNKAMEMLSHFFEILLPEIENSLESTRGEKSSLVGRLIK